jgi:hypothetical protein
MLPATNITKHLIKIMVICMGVSIASCSQSGALDTPMTVPSENNGSDVTDTPGETEELEPSPAPVAIPQDNAIYLGLYEGQEVIYLTRADLRGGFEGEPAGAQAYPGIAVSAAGEFLRPVDFVSLGEPRMVLAGGAEALSLVGFILDENQDVLYLASTYRGSAPLGVSTIHAIDLKNMERRELWTTVMGSVRYTGAQGYGFREVDYMGIGWLKELVAGRYLVLVISNCVNCGGPIHEGLVLMNLERGTERFLGAVTNLTLDLQAGTATFELIGEFQEPCEVESEYCFDGFYADYRPTGETVTIQLP